METILLLTLLNGGGFLLGGGLLHWLYHRSFGVVGDAGELDGSDASWKHQPGRHQSPKELREKLPLVFVNCVIINAFVGWAIHLSLTGSAWSTMYWPPLQHGWLTLVGGTAALFVWYHLMLFYFHHTMHRSRWLYRTFHHVHHKYKNPVWLDALYEHPFEAAWGGVVLSAPLYLWSVNGWGYFLFFGIVGMHEVLDHAGVRLDLPSFGVLSHSKAHDDHHRYFNVYYGQLLPTLDALHKTNERRTMKMFGGEPGGDDASR